MQIRFAVFSLIALSASLAGCLSAPQQFENVDTAIVDITVVDVETGKLDADQMVLIENGTITAVSDSAAGRLPASVAVIDGAGRFALPGLWDAHTHVISNHMGGFGPVLDKYVGHGITHLSDMGSPPDSFTAFRSWQTSAPSPQPHMLLSERRIVSEALPYGDTAVWEIIARPEEALSALQRQKESGVDFFKMYGPITPEIYNAVGEASRQLGIPFAGHIPLQIDFEDVIAARPATIEHSGFMFNGCGVDTEEYFRKAISARFSSTGENQHRIYADYIAALDWDTCREYLDKIAETGTAWTPTLTVVTGYGRYVDEDSLSGFAPDSLCMIERKAYLADGGEIEDAVMKAVETVIGEIRAAGIPILAGTDAETFCAVHGQSLVLELRLLEAAGLTRLEVLQSATSLPANVFNLSDQYGAIKPGMTADLILLDVSPLEDLEALSMPSGVYVDGRFLDRDTLVRMRHAE